MDLRSLLVFFLTIYCSISTQDYNELLDDEARINSLQPNTGNKDLIRHLLIDRKHCSNPETTWKCREECRVQFLSSKEKIPGLCQKPIPGDVCFGSPVDYSHVAKQDHFPLKYKVLENYPRCWSYLAPLMCSVHFRPCAVHKFTQKTENGTVEDGFAEMWATLRRSYCRQTLSACSDVINDGYFPEFISCDADNSTDVFSDNCMISNLPIPHKFSSKCPQPLVYIEKPVEGASPVHDSCYLKCRSDHVSSTVREYHSNYQTILGCVLALVFLLSFGLLRFFSQVHVICAVVFCVGQAFLCMAIYSAIWGLAFITSDEVECVEAEGHLLRVTEIQSHFLHWCSTQSLLLHFSLTAGFLWLVAATSLSLYKPDWLKEEKLRRRFQLRSFLTYGIYIFTLVFTLVVQMFHMQETDGVSGVCLVGIQSSSRHLAVCALLLVVTIVSSCCSLCVYRKQTKSFEEKALDSTRKIAEQNELYYKRRATEFLRRSGQANPTIEQLRDVDEETLEMAVRRGELDAEDPVEPSPYPTGPHIESFLERVQGRFVDNKMYKKFFDVDERVSPEEDLQHLTGLEYAGTLAQSYEPYRILWQESFGIYWIVSTVVSSIIVLLLFSALHPVLIAFDPSSEIGTIREYMRCAMDNSINHGYVEWVHGNRSEDAFASCQLKSYVPASRSTNIVFFYLLLPAIPFLILVTAMIAGFCGRGGMKSVRKCRWVPKKKDLGAITLETMPVITDEVVLPTPQEEEEAQENNADAPEAEDVAQRIEEAIADESEEELDEEEETPEEAAERGDKLGELRAKSEINKSRPTTSRGKARRNKVIVERIVDRVRQMLMNPNADVSGSVLDPYVDELRRLIENVRETGVTTGLGHQKARIWTAVELINELASFVQMTKCVMNRNNHVFGQAVGLLQEILQAARALCPNGKMPVMPGGPQAESITMFYDLMARLATSLPGLLEHTATLHHYHPQVQNAETLSRRTAEVLLSRKPLEQLQQQYNNNVGETGPSHRNLVPGQAGGPSNGAVGMQQAGLPRQAARPVQQNIAPSAAPPPVNGQPAQGNGQPAPFAGFAGFRPPNVVPVGSQNPPPESQRSRPFAGFQGFRPAATSAPVPAAVNGTVVQASLQGSAAPVHRHIPPELAEKLKAIPINGLKRPNGEVHRGTKKARETGEQPPRLEQHHRPAYGVLNQSQQPGPSKEQNRPPAHHVQEMEQQPGPSGIQQQNHRQEREEPRPQVEVIELQDTFDPHFLPVPHGFYTKFSTVELAVRISRASELAIRNPYPAQAFYLLILFGDIRPFDGFPPNEGETLVTPDDYEELWADDIRPQGIRAGTDPALFLRSMRRRALIMTSIFGHHWNARGRPGTYEPPRINLNENDADFEINLARYGGHAVLRMREILELFNDGDLPIRPAPEIPEVDAFAQYFDSVATMLGHPHQREEYVHDPMSSPEVADEEDANNTEDDNNEAVEEDDNNDQP